MKQFEQGDIIINSVVAHPRTRVLCYSGKMYYTDTAEESIKMNDFLFQENLYEAPVVTQGLLLESGLFLLTEDGDYILLG